MEWDIIDKQIVYTSIFSRRNRAPPVRVRFSKDGKKINPAVAQAQGAGGAQAGGAPAPTARA